ncbi:alpha-tocopherol transfer protein-like [Schistocerca americana]|uniref:alpha-tocopherol transfer protein-like n=1 Tax=Schistocerca americana TaxID=7009 RepID=UPI001F4FF5D2|nr:alpha-tocopherol transfer protein-like [Schistocerca americana]
MPPTEMKVITVADEFSKNPELKEDDLQHLRDWVSKQSHLPNIPDDQLILFLHSCYYSLERAKKTIEASYTIRCLAPEMFSDRDPLKPELQAVWKMAHIASLPKRDPEGNKVIVVKLADTDPQKFNHADATKVFLLAMDASLREDGTVPGYHFIYDTAGLAMGHLARCNFTVLRKYMVYVQEGLRIRMKSVNTINMSAVADKVMGVVKPLMKKELMDHMYFYSTDLEPLYSRIPRSILPKDFGGEEATMAELSDVLKAKVEANRDWYIETESWKSDESKRAGKSVSAGELFGVEGSFKKLDID